MNFASWESYVGSKRSRKESYKDDDDDDDGEDDTVAADAELALQLALEEFDEQQSVPQSSSSSSSLRFVRLHPREGDRRDSDTFRRRLLRNMEARITSCDSLASLPSPGAKCSNSFMHTKICVISK